MQTEMRQRARQRLDERLASLKLENRLAMRDLQRVAHTMK